MKIKIKNPFSSSSKVDAYDTRQVKRILNRLGYYIPPAKIGTTPVPDSGVFTALKAFQKDNGLTPDGHIKPGDTTEMALNDALERQDPNTRYIWRTVKDEKVRSSHADRDGQVFTWSTVHDDGEPFGCRCWAEPVPASDPIRNESERNTICLDILKEIDFIKQQKKDLEAKQLSKGREIRDKEKTLEILRDQIIEKIKEILPDENDLILSLPTMDIDRFLAFVSKTVSRFKTAFNTGVILSVLKGMSKLKEEIEALEKEIDEIQQKIYEKIEELNNSSTEFRLLCHGFFDNT